MLDSLSNDLRVVDLTQAGSPSEVGSLSLDEEPTDIHVSGRYAYIVDKNSEDLKVIDISNPSSPSIVGTPLSIGASPTSIFVSGHYAYVVESGATNFKVIDVFDPASPSLAGSLNIGTASLGLYVSGRYAYVTDQGSGKLKIIDISDPSTPSLTGGSIMIGSDPVDIFASGRYAYIIDKGIGEVKVIDVIDPSSPNLEGSLMIGSDPESIFVMGHHAYVVDSGSDDLKVIDISGADVTSLIAHSAEAGNLHVRNDVIVQGQLQVASGITVGAGGMYSDGDIGVSGILSFAFDTIPEGSPTGLVQLYADTVAASTELKVRDEAGNITTLSPHNFSLTGMPSEPMACSYYSENNYGKINVDMLRTVRLVENLSGEKLVYIKNNKEVPNEIFKSNEETPNQELDINNISSDKTRTGLKNELQDKYEMNQSKIRQLSEQLNELKVLANQMNLLDNRE